MDGQYYKIMEASSITSLLEKVLSGRPGDTQKHSALAEELFTKLGKTTQSNLRAAGITLSNLRTQKKLGLDDFNNFSIYLKNLISGKPAARPATAHLSFTNHPSSQKAAKLCQAIQTIQLKRLTLLGSSFHQIKAREHKTHIEQMENLHKLETKRLQCAKMIAQLKGALGINMEKTVRL